MDERTYYAVAELRDVLRNANEAIENAKADKVFVGRAIATVGHASKAEIAEVMGISVSALGALIGAAARAEKTTHRNEEQP